MRKKKIDGTKFVRDSYWFVDETILQELQKPGLSQEERTFLSDKIRENRLNWRKYEEGNEKVSKKEGEAIGIIKGGCAAVAGFLVGTLVLALRKLI